MSERFVGNVTHYFHHLHVSAVGIDEGAPWSADARSLIIVMRRETGKPPALPPASRRMAVSLSVGTKSVTTAMLSVGPPKAARITLTTSTIQNLISGRPPFLRMGVSSWAKVQAPLEVRRAVGRAGRSVGWVICRAEHGEATRERYRRMDWS